jgi:hypothetical protein
VTEPLRQREPRVEDKPFLAFLRRQRCCVCGAPPRVHAAHVRMSSRAHGKRECGKAERPSDRWAVPLCVACHTDGPEAQHRIGEERFWRVSNLDPFAIATAFYAEHKGAKPMMAPGVECEFVLQGGRRRRPTPALDPELYAHPVVRPSKYRIRIKNSRKNSSRNFIFSTDKSGPKRKRASVSRAKVRRLKRKWPSRPLHGTTRWPKRKMRSGR